MDDKANNADASSHVEMHTLASDDSSNHNESASLLSKRILRRVDLRILPLAAWMYLLNYLDRGNIGNARVLNEETGDSLVQQTGMSPVQYALAVTLFSIAYAVFEVPANWVMKNYVRPSMWLAFLLFAWGAFTMGFAGVQNFASVAALRIMIGIFEAGFFPGLVLLITYWYRPEERSIRIALIVSSATLAGAFGGCIAYGVGHMNGIGGIEGFRWLSILEGALTVVSVIPVALILPDRPLTSKFLSEDEKDFAHMRVQQAITSTGPEEVSKKHVLRQTLEPRMLLHYIAYLTNAIPLGSLTFFTPTIVAGLDYTSVTAQIMTVPPWILGWVVSILIAWSADRYNERSLHIAACTIVGGIGWLATGLLPVDAYKARYGCLMLCSCGAFPTAAPLSAWVTANSPSLAAMAFVIAINNSTGGLSQFVCQWIFLPRESEQGYPTANYICAACSFATAIIALVLRMMYTRFNRQSKGRGADVRTWYR